jgi:hypothetical protein
MMPKLFYDRLDGSASIFRNPIASIRFPHLERRATP